ncbi:ferredoxin [Nocardiopsis flavescens]|uniref:Ferredoxin n=1 Tax=Nocardiopsis flavescens TaxID=758803 RepID=A0A1M6LCN7_9ACTN|nr:ferredoxin [Nocardiopsis flavescens]
MVSPAPGSGPRLHADTDVCAGAGQCVRAAPELFDQDDGGLVVLLAADVPQASLPRALDAVDLCPSGAIGLR